MTEAGSPAPRRERYALWAAAVLVAAIGLAAGAVGTSSLRLDGATGDWRGASEGLSRSGSTPVLAAGRHVVVHFHGLDGRPAVVEVVAAARPASTAVVLSATTGTGSGFATFPIGLEPTSVRIPIPRGTHDVDLRLQGSDFFRVSRIALLRSLGATTIAVIVLPAILGVIALVFSWGKCPPWAAITWGILAAVGASWLWTFVADPASSLRVPTTTRDALRIAVLAALWVAALACARSRVVPGLAVVATVAILHLPTIWYGFHQDDFALARGWSWTETAATLHGEFDPSGMIPAYYRPMVRLLWALDHALWGSTTRGYHATNLCLHALAGAVLLALLRRAGLPEPAALLGALAWVAHPLAASGATWVSARGDSLMTVFYLAALLVFSTPGPPTPRSQVALALLTALALGTKEMAASLPLAALLFDRFLLPREERALRRRRIVLIAAIAAAYYAFWVSLFASKLMGRVASGPRWAGFDFHDPAQWLRLVPGLYAPVFLPTSYEEWWLTSLEGWSWPYFLTALSLVGAAWLVARGTRLGGACATVGVVWPLVTVLPLLGLPSTLDFYRLAYLVAVAVAFVVAGLAVRLWSGRSWRSRSSPRRWRPRCHHFRSTPPAPGRRKAIEAARSSIGPATDRAWAEQLTPEMRRRFEETVAWRCHALRWASSESACP